jgi:putative membrane protein
MESLDQSKALTVKKIIIALSIAIPVVVALLFKIKIEGYNFSGLPAIYAGINGLTAIILIVALVAIKMKNIELHKRLIQIALGLSLLFLVLYVTYHMTSDPTMYGDNNHDNTLDILERTRIKGTSFIYYFILISHIILSVGVIPIVLFTYLFAWQGDFKRHKKWTKIAFPLWLYVAVTGVVVYYMISPFYK